MEYFADLLVAGVLKVACSIYPLNTSEVSPTLQDKRRVTSEIKGFVLD